jgi:hypothetical protein
MYAACNNATKTSANDKYKATKNANDSDNAICFIH